jgi:hypothetical protein
MSHEKKAPSVVTLEKSPLSGDLPKLFLKRKVIDVLQ